LNLPLLSLIENHVDMGEKKKKDKLLMNAYPSLTILLALESI